jgi:flagellar protein FlgJ
MAAATLSFGPTPALKGAVVSPALAAKAMKATNVSPAYAAKARTTAQDFEAVFLNSMFGQMFAGVGDGPFSGGQAANTWRSFLTEEYAKNFAKAGGIGIADHVYGALIAQQEVRAK